MFFSKNINIIMYFDQCTQFHVSVRVLSIREAYAINILKQVGITLRTNQKELNPLFL